MFEDTSRDRGLCLSPRCLDVQWLDPQNLSTLCHVMKFIAIHYVKDQRSEQENSQIESAECKTVHLAFLREAKVILEF